MKYICEDCGEEATPTAPCFCGKENEGSVDGYGDVTL